MSGQQHLGDDASDQGRVLQDVLRRLSDLEQRPVRIPILAADPAVENPCNIWLLHDGRLRTRKLNSAGNAFVIDEWVRTAPGSSTSATTPASPGAAPVSRQSSYGAVWSRAYKADGNARTDDLVNIYYGWRDATNGRQRSYVGFDYTTIAADLASSTVNKVEFRLTNLRADDPAGSDLTFGIHNVSGGTAPAVWSGTVASALDVEKFGTPDTHVVNLPLEFATYLRDGIGKGIAIEAPDDSISHAGYAAGVASGYSEPLLTVYYAK